ncbi:hypothetical protein MHBO_005154 [Bonamia ostreae]|uniref:NADH dehydrogenase subunit 5 n=1 Tax=Bonamia ostreae TaxID=126728 RepID=A0ABV2AV74_9EUKA
MDALFGVALALVFPYLGLMIAPHNKEAVLAMIFVSTLIVIFFVGANNAVRFWFSVHNIYFFFIFLSGF